MDASPLLSDLQATGLVTAITVGLGAIAAAIKWVGGRFVKSLDEMQAQSKKVSDSLIELRGVVSEGRDDIREIRDWAVALSERPLERPIDQSERRRDRRTGSATPLAISRVPRRVVDEP